MTTFRRIKSNLNAYQFSFDENLLDEIRDVYLSTLSEALSSPPLSTCFEGGKVFESEIEVKNKKYYLLSYGKAPLMWISNNSLDTYKVFKRFFDSLNIKEEVKRLVDCDKDITMYCGFFVVGKYLDREVWHVDYFNGANAYTLLTPLFELDDCHGHLLYKDGEARINKYAYKLGEAIIVGDNLSHTTEVYPKTSELRVLVSLTFGTDKLKYWDILKETVGSQSKFMMLPCGHQKGICKCLVQKSSHV